MTRPELVEPQIRPPRETHLKHIWRSAAGYMRNNHPDAMTDAMAAIYQTGASRDALPMLMRAFSNDTLYIIEGDCVTNKILIIDEEESIMGVNPHEYISDEDWPTKMHEDEPPEWLQERRLSVVSQIMEAIGDPEHIKRAVWVYMCILPVSTDGSGMATNAITHSYEMEIDISSGFKRQEA